MVYETDGVAVSFLSSEYWKTSEIEGTYIELSDDGDLKQCQVSIPNVSYKENVMIFKKYYDQKKKSCVIQKLNPDRIFCNVPESYFRTLYFAKMPLGNARKMSEYQKQDKCINVC